MRRAGRAAAMLHGISITSAAEGVLARASEEAARQPDAPIARLLLDALLRAKCPLVESILGELGLDAALAEMAFAMPGEAAGAEMPRSTREDCLLLAGAVAASMGHARIGTAHLLVALAPDAKFASRPGPAPPSLHFDRVWRVANRQLEELEALRSGAAPSIRSGPSRIYRRLVAQASIAPIEIVESLVRETLAGGDALKPLIERGAISEWELAAALGNELNLPFITLSHYEIPPEVLAALPPEVARRLRALPVDFSDNILTIALGCRAIAPSVDEPSPTSIKPLSELQSLVPWNLVPVITFESDLDDALDRYYPRPARGA